MRPLTKRQTEVLTVVKRLVSRHGYPPTLREISDSMGITNTATRDHLMALQRAGKVDWTPKRARTLRIL